MNFSKLITRADLPNLVRRISPTGNISINGLVVKPNGFIIGVPKNIQTRVDTVGNVGSGSDLLHSYTLPGGYLGNNGDYLDVIYAGGAVAGATFQIIVKFDGTTIHTAGVLTASAGANWTYRIRYVRVTSTAIFAIISVGDASATPSFDVMTSLGFTIGSLANNRALEVFGESTTAPANNDVTQFLSTIELTQNT